MRVSIEQVENFTGKAVAVGNIIIWDLCDICGKTNQTASLICPECREETRRKQCRRLYMVFGLINPIIKNNKWVSRCDACRHRFKCYTERTEP